VTDRETISLLIAEDDPHMRYLMEIAASRAGGFSRIELAPDGQAALDILRSRKDADYPDLLISDLAMPRLDGLNLIRELKRDPQTRRIPIAIVTSSDIPNDRRDVLAAGAYAFVEKPRGIEALTHVLETLRDSCLTSSATR